MNVKLHYAAVLDRKSGKDSTVLALYLDDRTQKPLIAAIQDDQITWSTDGERTILVPFHVALHLGYLTDGTQDARTLTLDVWALRRLIDAASSTAPNSKEKAHQILDYWLRENAAIV